MWLDDLALVMPISVGDGCVAMVSRGAGPFTVRNTTKAAHPTPTCINF